MNINEINVLAHRKSVLEKELAQINEALANVDKSVVLDTVGLKLVEAGFEVADSARKLSYRMRIGNVSSLSVNFDKEENVWRITLSEHGKESYYGVGDSLIDACEDFHVGLENFENKINEAKDWYNVGLQASAMIIKIV
jgi:hypothetical protein